MVGIYKITSPSGKIYIGQSRCVNLRWQNHRKINAPYKSIVLSSIKKYGKSEHLFEVIHELPDDIEQHYLDEIETLYIARHKECGFDMMNIKLGGGGGGVKYNMIGEKYGRLLVVERDLDVKDTAYRCICECGNMKTIGAGALRDGKTRSCGCYNMEVLHTPKHGHAACNDKKTPTYNSWAFMVYNAKQFSIPIDERWYSFKEFLFDVGERPLGTKLYCFGKNIGYNKENCRWVTTSELRRLVNKKQLVNGHI